RPRARRPARERGPGCGRASRRAARRGVPCEASLATGHAALAAVREGEVGATARADVHVAALLDARGLELPACHGPQVEHAPACHSVEVLKSREHLGADLVAAGARSWTDEGGWLRVEPPASRCHD